MSGLFSRSPALLEALDQRTNDLFDLADDAAIRERQISYVIHRNHSQLDLLDPALCPAGLELWISVRAACVTQGRRAQKLFDRVQDNIWAMEDASELVA